MRTRSASPPSRTPWLIAGVVATAMLLVWQRVQARHYQRESARLQQDIDALRYENGRLDTQIHQWVSPSHLDSLAKTTFKMAPPDARQMQMLPQ